MVYNLTECAALFFAYAAMGWFMEVLYMGVRERHLTNRGFLLGPCCPIYGAGMLGFCSGGSIYPDRRSAGGLHRKGGNRFY